MLLSGRRGRGGEATTYCFKQEKGSSGPKSCRRASAGILFCVGEGRRGRWQEIALNGKREFGLEVLPQSEHRDIVLCVGKERKGRRQDMVLGGRGDGGGGGVG